MRMRGAAWLLLAAPAALMLSACNSMSTQSDGRSEGARDFPSADRPVAPIISTRWSTEEARDRVHEAEDIMNRAGITPGMTVADLGAGEGYYTVRLAKRVGPKGRVLAEDIVAEVIDVLGRRVTRENMENVSVKLGTPDDPKLPVGSFDRVLMVHMYHEIAEPYAFLWHLYPALKTKGEIIVVEPNRPPEQHGMSPELLQCEFAAVGYVQTDFVQRPAAGAYMARFKQGAGKPRDPDQIIPCQVRRSADHSTIAPPSPEG